VLVLEYGIWFSAEKCKFTTTGLLRELSMVAVLLNDMVKTFI
jgi:hypothetical protein